MVYEVMCKCDFKVLRFFMTTFEMYEFSTAIFIKVFSYQIFDVKFMVKNWWRMAFTLGKYID